MRRSRLGPATFDEALAIKRARKPQLRAPLNCRGARLKTRKPMKARSTPAPGSVGELENQLDDLVRQVLRRSERVCFTDGKEGTSSDPLEISHLFGRAKRPTRFDVHPEGNNHLQHKSCNQRHNRDKSIYRNEFIRRYGKEAYEELERRVFQNQHKTFSYIELHRMIEQRKAMLK